MTERSKREIVNWTEENLPGDGDADVDLSDEEARIARKHDMIQRGIKPDESLTVREQHILQRVADRTP